MTRPLSFRSKVAAAATTAEAVSGRVVPPGQAGASAGEVLHYLDGVNSAAESITPNTREAAHQPICELQQGLSRIACLCFTFYPSSLQEKFYKFFSSSWCCPVGRLHS